MKNLVKFNLIGFLFLGISSYSDASSIAWQPCQDAPTFLCGMLTVPIDYQHPDVGTLQLPVTMHPASNGKQGSLILNAGGPWYDDTETVQGIFPSLSNDIQDHFDIVGFAPRGTGPNEINCHSDQMDSVHELDRVINLTYLNTLNGAKQVYESTTAQRNLCQYDPLYQHASTKNTVQDLDQLRQALKSEKINYYGASYGTRLGLAYLITYPTHVNNMVLDANVAPNNDYLKFIESAAKGSEDTMQAFFNFCFEAGNQCPLYRSSPQAIQALYQTLLNKAETQGIPTSDKYAHHPLTAAMLSFIVMGSLGDSTSWPDLASALNEAISSNNADTLMEFYIAGTTYDPASNTYQNYNDGAVHNAVICADYTIPKTLQDESSWLAQMQILQQRYPLDGGMWGTFFGEACIKWPGISDPLLPSNVKPISNANPTVLLVSNTFDPLTPPSSAQEESQYLSAINISNKILTWQGAGHGAYLDNTPPNGCVGADVDQFFLTGKLPSISTCSDGVNPFEQSQLHRSSSFKLMLSK